MDSNFQNFLISETAMGVNVEAQRSTQIEYITALPKYAVKKSIELLILKSKFLIKSFSELLRHLLRDCIYHG